jgi:hypothetical protein
VSGNRGQDRLREDVKGRRRPESERLLLPPTLVIPEESRSSGTVSGAWWLMAMRTRSGDVSICLLPVDAVRVPVSGDDRCFPSTMAATVGQCHHACRHRMS